MGTLNILIGIKIFGKIQINSILMKKINNFHKNKPFIVAEIGNNHEGSFLVAKKLILEASKAGVDAVKFQTFITGDFVNDYIKTFNCKDPKFFTVENTWNNYDKLAKVLDKRFLKWKRKRC